MEKMNFSTFVLGNISPLPIQYKGINQYNMK